MRKIQEVLVSSLSLLIASAFFLSSCSSIQPIALQEESLVKPELSYQEELASSLIENGHPLLSPLNPDDTVAKAVNRQFRKMKSKGIQPVEVGLVKKTSMLIPKKSSAQLYQLEGAEELNLDNHEFDIPVVYNASVKKWISFFLNKGKNYFIRYVQRAGRYAPLMAHILEEQGMPQDLIFLAMAESGFVNQAKSWASAVGPWQFIAATAKRFDLKMNWYVDERRDPIKATLAAAKYLKDLYARFGDWEIAAAGYNAGEGKLGRAIKKYKTDDFWKISQGKYLKKETKNYVPKIMALAIIGKNLSAFGFKDIDFYEPIDFDEIAVAGNTDLITLAEKIGVEFEELQRLNPELLRWQTPPDVNYYPLRLPVGSKIVWNVCCEANDFIAEDYKTYQIVSSHASIKDVARKFNLRLSALTLLNNIKSDAVFEKGKVLLLPFRSDHRSDNALYAAHYSAPKYRYKKRRRTYNRTIAMAQKKGEVISRPKAFYQVQNGDTLWDVSQKTGISLNTLVRSNMGLLKDGRMIRSGDKLAIR